jgi:hypothetical protein
VLVHLEPSSDAEKVTLFLIVRNIWGLSHVGSFGPWLGAPAHNAPTTHRVRLDENQAYRGFICGRDGIDTQNMV